MFPKTILNPENMTICLSLAILDLTADLNIGEIVTYFRVLGKEQVFRAKLKIL